MKIKLVCIGNKLPQWLVTGIDDYRKRFTPPWTLTLHELPCPKRHKNINIAKLKQQEATSLLAACPRSDLMIALDERGLSLNTRDLAKQLDQYQSQGQSMTLFIGGPDGLDDDLLATCQQSWSLSPLTFPHGFARLVVIEQLYRAISLLNNHPYHRE